MILPLIWTTKLDVYPKRPVPLPLETFPLSGPNSVLQPLNAPVSKPMVMLAEVGGQHRAIGTRTLERYQASSLGGVRAND